MLSTSWKLLRQKCNFSEVEFALFQNLLIVHLRKPKNHVGLEGPWPIRRRRAWEKWLDVFIDDGIGNQYWGQGMARKWSLQTERDRIRSFLREAVMFVARITRQEVRAEKKRLWKAQRSPELSNIIFENGILEGYPENPKSEIECCTLENVLKQEQHGNGLLGHFHRQRGLSHDTSSSSAIQPATTPETYSSIYKQSSVCESRIRRRKSLVVIDIDPELDGPSQKQQYRNTERFTNTEKVTNHLPLEQKPSESTSKSLFSVIIGNRMLRTQRASAITRINPGDVPPASDILQSAAETDSRQTSVFPTSNTNLPDLHQYQDFVLETRLNVSTEIKLVYGTGFLSLLSLVDMIRDRHHLRPNQEILGVKVTIKGKIFDMNLGEVKDWKYISESIVENGLRAQVLILTS